MNLRERINAVHRHGVAVKQRIKVLWNIEHHLEAQNRHNREQLKRETPSGPITMYDSVNVASLPRGAQAVAGYVGGAWPTFYELQRQFPHAHKLSIAVNAREDAMCLDVETGDATPDEAPAWVRRQHARGIKRPWLYANASTMPAVEGKITANGISRSQVRLWVAHYDGVAEVPRGFDAKQYTQTAMGRTLDASVVNRDAFDN